MLVRYSNYETLRPWNLFSDLNREMDRFFSDSSLPKEKFRLETVASEATVHEDEDAITVKVNISGLNSSDFDLEVDGDLLRINAQKHAPELGESEKYLKREIGYGHFRHNIKLSSKVESKKIGATYNDGVLTILMPKVEAVKPRKIEVK
jgi:HSP20 family protein